MDRDLEGGPHLFQPSVHRVPSPKRYAAEDSEGRPAALLSYHFQDRLNRMFPHALTERGLCIACTSRVDGIMWSPAGPIGCSICGYQYPNPLDLSQDERSFDSDEHILSSHQCSEDDGEKSPCGTSSSVAGGRQAPACDVVSGSDGEAYTRERDALARGLNSVSRADDHAQRAESLVRAMSQYSRDMALSASGCQASACGSVALSVLSSDVRTDEENNCFSASDASLSASGRQAAACGVNSSLPSHIDRPRRGPFCGTRAVWC